MGVFVNCMSAEDLTRYLINQAVDEMVSASNREREQTLVEKERMAEPVSVMEREKTMRNLVDIQRKVEQKQQRDKERQLLRVRKADGETSE